MFTGLVEHLGVVVAVRDISFGRVLLVDAGDWGHRPALGDSIAVNGCCLTVSAGDSGDPRGRGDSVEPSETAPLRFDVIRQTLDATTLGDLKVGDRVNLEHAVTPATLLGGHIVQGHVDGVAAVRFVQRDDTEWRLQVEPPAPLMDVIVERGSVALDGVSLTVATIGRDYFEVALIPTTLAVTTLGQVDSGDRLNIETDYVAKTIVHWLRRQREGGTESPET